MPAEKTLRESQIEARLVDYCRTKGIYTRKFASPAHAGVPDRILIRDGVVLFLELKRDGERPTSLQLRELTLINEAGASATWAAGWPEVKTKVDTYFP